MPTTRLSLILLILQNPQNLTLERLFLDRRSCEKRFKDSTSLNYLANDDVSTASCYEDDFRKLDFAQTCVSTLQSMVKLHSLLDKHSLTNFYDIIENVR